MARNPVRGRGRPELPATPAAAPVQLWAGLVIFVIGAGVAIPWLARPSASAVVPPLVSLGAEPPNAPAQVAIGAASASTAGGPESRPFMDAAASGATAYASGDYEGALASYFKAVERNPTDAESQSNLGQVLVRLNRVAEALPHFERAIELMPERWAYHFNRGRALALLLRLDEAIAAYRVAQQLFPEDYATAFNLAQTLHRKGDEAGAVEQYRKAITLDPDDASFRLALGVSLEKLDKRAEAAAAYAEYLRLAPQAPDADRVRARIAQLTAPAS